MPGFHSHWHFNGVDRVVLAMTGEVPTGVTWTTGSGNVLGGTAVAPSPNTTPPEYWLTLPGYAYSKFRYVAAATPVLERYRPDGYVTRYEAVPGLTNTWRPKTWFDPYDNATTYEWGTSGTADGRVVRIVGPRGVGIGFTWNQDGSVGVRYFQLQGQTETVFTELSWLFQLDGLGRMTWLRGPATDYVKVPGSGVLHDLSQVYSKPKGVLFTYGTNSLATTIEEFRGTVGGGDFESCLAFSTTYHASQVYGQYRVWTQQDQWGQTHTFTYEGSGSTLTKTIYTNPLQNVYELSVDAQGRMTHLKVTPPSGLKPRAAAGESAGDVEPASLEWAFEYGTCPCSKVTKVTYPSGVVQTMTYDSEHGRLLTLTVPSADPAVATVTHTWTYTSFQSGSLPDDYSTNVTGVATWSYAYNLVSRGQGLYGTKPTEWTLQSSAITNQQGASTVSERVVLDSYGRTDYVEDPLDAVVSFDYGDGAGDAGLLHTITRDPGGSSTQLVTSLVSDVLGRITSVSVGPSGGAATTTLVTDPFGRPTEETTSPGAGNGPALKRKHYRDAWDNLAVTLFENKDRNGAAPTYDDGSGGGRQWIRHEWQYVVDRLYDSFIDRRSLADGEDLANPITGANPWLVHYSFDYRGDGQLYEATLPNGSVHRYEVDGYGTLYRIRADINGLNQEAERYFFDQDLVLKKIKRKVADPTSGQTVDTETVFARNTVNSKPGYLYKVTDPTGVSAEVAYSPVGWVLNSWVKNPTGTARSRSESVHDELGRVRLAQQFKLDSGGSQVGSPLVTTFVYNARSQILSVQDDAGRKSSREYDAVGRLKKVVDNLSTDPNACNEVELSYFSQRDFVEQMTARLVEGSGRRTFVQAFTRDLLGQAKEVRDLGENGTQTAHTIKYWYNSLGMLTHSEDTEQRGMVALFDADGRWVEQVLRESLSQAGQKVRLTSTYDDLPVNGRMRVRRFDGNGFESRTEYDALYRPVMIYRPGADYTTSTTGPHKTKIEYDVGSRAWKYTDGNGSVIEQKYDLASRLVKRVASAGAGVSTLATQEDFAYDDVGRLFGQGTTAGVNHDYPIASTSYERDGLGRVAAEHFRYTGVDVNRLVTVRSGYGYGSSQEDPGFRRSLKYQRADGAGGWTTDLDLSMVPDTAGRLSEVKVEAPSGERTLATYGYGVRGVKERSLFYQLQQTSTYKQVTTSTFDAYRRLATLGDSLFDGSTAIGTLSSFTFTWSNAGDLLKEAYTKRDGTAGDRFDYDPFHRLKGVKYGVSTNGMGQNYAAADFAREVAYSLDPGNNRSSVTETLWGQSGTQTQYTLTGSPANSPRYAQVGSANYQYDNEGNLTFDGTFYFVYDFKNRLSEVWIAAEGESQSLSLDQKVQRKAMLRRRPTEGALGRARTNAIQALGGDLLQVAKSASARSKVATTSAALETSDPLTSSSNSSSASLQLVALYGYDTFNRRVLRQVFGSTIWDLRYAYDGWQETQELVPVSTVPTPIRSFVWGVRLDELLVYRRHDPGGPVDYYAAQGRNDSVVRLTTQTGTVVESVEYDSYGKASVYAGANAAALTSSVGNPFLYNGKRLDEETSLLYFRNRYYSPAIGRFLSIDTRGEWYDNASLGCGYAACGNDPLTMVDYMGNEAEPWYAQLWRAIRDKVDKLLGKLEQKLQETIEKAKKKVRSEAGKQLPDLPGREDGLTPASFPSDLLKVPKKLDQSKIVGFDYATKREILESEVSAWALDCGKIIGARMLCNATLWRPLDDPWDRKADDKAISITSRLKQIIDADLQEPRAGLKYEARIRAENGSFSMDAESTVSVLGILRDGDLNPGWKVRVALAREYRSGWFFSCEFSKDSSGNLFAGLGGGITF
ncbi:MAG: RHS repeat-associated core domain-containing protein [Planctomycetes bacterium]|nr:RHS repeat-associated core domain-containing protein [Planctomycetota bacterium]